MTNEMQIITPCRKCNEIHKGAPLDHEHEDAEGVGYVRLLVIGGVEFCWRCSCQKSAWVNIPNTVSTHCVNPLCICHIADRAH